MRRRTAEVLRDRLVSGKSQPRQTPVRLLKRRLVKGKSMMPKMKSGLPKEKLARSKLPQRRELAMGSWSNWLNARVDCRMRSIKISSGERSSQMCLTKLRSAIKKDKRSRECMTISKSRKSLTVLSITGQGQKHQKIVLLTSSELARMRTSTKTQGSKNLRLHCSYSLLKMAVFHQQLASIDPQTYRLFYEMMQ